MSNIPHIVVLGGGYVAVKCVRKLHKAIKQKKIKVTVIDYNNFHCFHGLVPEMIVGKVQPANVITPARHIFLPAQFHNAEILDVDFNKKQVNTHRLIDGKKYTIDYDYLVVDVGTKDDLSRYPGIAENTFRLKAYIDCFQLRSHLPMILELAEIEQDPEERKRLLTFVIAGGNFAGVEIATEISEYVELMTKHEFPNIKKEEISIYLLNAGDTILPELAKSYKKLVDYAAKQISKRIHIKLNTRLKSTTPSMVITNNDEKIKTRTIISCTGMTQNELIKDWPFEFDERGRIKTDNHLQVLGQQNIWSGGDCAAVPMKSGQTAPPLAIYAMRSGSTIGHNILATLGLEKKKIIYKFNGLGDACSISFRKGVGHLKGFQIKGFAAWLCWRIAMIVYLPNWDRRVRVMLNWIVYPLFGRDIASIQTEPPIAITERFYEAGEDVFKMGDTGNVMYLIIDGEADVIREDGDDSKEQHVATLGRGEYFGEIAIFHRCHRTATVRAKSPLKVLEIKRRAAEILGATIPLNDNKKPDQQ